MLLKTVEDRVVSSYREENTKSNITFIINELSKFDINLKINIRVEYVDVMRYRKFLWFKFNKQIFENDFMRVSVTAYFDFGGYPSFHYLVFNNRLDYEQNKKVIFELPQQRFYTCLVVNYPNEITEGTAVNMAMDEVISVIKDYIRCKGEKQGFKITI